MLFYQHPFFLQRRNMLLYEYQTDLFGGSSNHGGTSYHPTGAGTVMYSLAANDYVTWNIGTYSASGSGSSQIYGAKGTRFWGYLVA